MESLTEDQLRFLAERVVQLAVLGGLVGAMLLHLILGGINAAAEYFARKSLAAARIRAARSRATAAPVAVAAPGEPHASDPPGHYCTENYSTHEWVSDLCVTCGARADWGRAT